MNVKNFLAAGLAGFVVDYLLGWVLWGMLGPSLFCCEKPTPENMTFIALGCLSFGVIISYVFVRWAAITNAISGLKAGAIFGLLFGLYDNFFKYSKDSFCMQDFCIDVLFMTISGAAVGAVVALVNGKMK